MKLFLRLLIHRVRGVKFISTTGVFIGPKVQISKGAIIYPNVYINGDSYIGKDTVILPNAKIEDSYIMDNCVIGAEVIRSILHNDVNAKHSCYIGDASIGQGCNIGAGVVFCNYNGYEKNRIIVQRDTFIGSGSMLIAPLLIGRTSYIAAGSVVKLTVNPNTLVIARGQQHKHAAQDSDVKNEIHKSNYVRKIKGKWHLGTS
ncbi:MAG: hypothetical protein WD712_00725 [Candidatus Spechtbacterales bacterium]